MMMYALIASFTNARLIGRRRQRTHRVLAFTMSSMAGSVKLAVEGRESRASAAARLYLLLSASSDMSFSRKASSVTFFERRDGAGEAVPVAPGTAFAAAAAAPFLRSASENLISAKRRTNACSSTPRAPRPSRCQSVDKSSCDMPHCTTMRIPFTLNPCGES
jgi:hypothetical protein